MFLLGNIIISHYRDWGKKLSPKTAIIHFLAVFCLE